MTMQNPAAWLERVRHEAEQNIDIKTKFPDVDNPALAIDFALDKIDDHLGRIAFLERWREGAWFVLKREWPDYIEGLS